MSDEPWTIERLRRMTRQQFAECVKRGDLPPTDIAVAFMEERLSQAARTTGQSSVRDDGQGV